MSLINGGMNPKALQYIMGEDDCSIVADGFTTSFTTIERENLRGHEGI